MRFVTIVCTVIALLITTIYPCISSAKTIIVCSFDKSSYFDEKGENIRIKV